MAGERVYMPSSNQHYVTQEQDEYEEVLAVPAGGGAQTATATITVDKLGSEEHVFDLGAGAHAVLVTLTALAYDADGETFGNGEGTIFAGNGLTPALTTNADNGVHWKNLSDIPVDHYVAEAGGMVFELQNDGTATVHAIVLAARYLRVRPFIVSNDTGAAYDGANDPTVEVQIDVTY